MTRKTGAVAKASARLAALALATLVVACGGDGQGDTPIAYDNHLPLAVGDRQVYRQTFNWGAAGDATTFPTETVTGTRQVGGKLFHLVESDEDGIIASALYGTSASAIQIRDPDDTALGMDLVRFPAHEGGSFVQDLGPFTDNDADGDGSPDPYSTRYTTSIQGIGTIATPAGSFTQALQVRDHIVMTTRLTGNGAVETENYVRDTWYVPGVGRVRTEMSGDGYLMVSELMLRAPAGQPRTDTQPPSILSVSPSPTSPVHAGTPLVLTFDEPVTDSGLAAISVIDRFGNTVSLERLPPGDATGRTVTLAPLAGWNEGTYTLRIATGVRDLAGNTMGGRADSTFSVSGAFAVTFTSPYRQGVNVRQSTGPLTAFTNKAIDLSTLATVRLREGGSVVAATVQADLSGTGFTVTPASPLKPSTRYTVDLSGVRSTLGLAIANAQDWTFTTGSTVSATTSGPTVQPTGLPRLRSR